MSVISNYYIGSSPCIVRTWGGAGTIANAQNPGLFPKWFGITALGLSAGNGILGAYSNFNEASIDIQSGNTVRASINRTQAALYTVGTIALFIPGGQLVGAWILFGTTITDIGQNAYESDPVYY